MAKRRTERPRVAVPLSVAVGERAEATRAALLASARRHFVERGYHDTATEDIVRDADVTRGALYHHFADKKALFVAVFTTIEEELIASAATDGGGADAYTRLCTGLIGFLDASLTPEVQRVLLLDGPAVLGWQEWRDLEAHYGLGAIKQLLTDAIEQGTIAPQSVDPLAHILLAAVDEAALYIANAAEPTVARDAAVHTMNVLLAGIGGPPPKRRTRK